MANCTKCGNIMALCQCGTRGDGSACWPITISDGTMPRHPIYDALDAHMVKSFDYPPKGPNYEAGCYYLASQIAELMQRIEKLEGVK